MRILVTNDDGIHAEGLAVLEAIARAFTDDVWVVAPETEQSGASRALTLTAPVRVRAIADKRFAVSGTPSDCVLLALQDLIKGGAPDMVLSGVNRGQNIAEDVTFSGTVAAALQGMQLGVPSIAFSLAKGFRPEGDMMWETAKVWGAKTLKALVGQGFDPAIVMNVNIPDCPIEAVTGIEATFQGNRDEAMLHLDLRTDLRGQGYYWIGYRGKLSSPPDGSDLKAIYENRVSVTPLHVDLTHGPSLARLSGVFGKGGHNG